MQDNIKVGNVTLNKQAIEFLNHLDNDENIDVKDKFLDDVCMRLLDNAIEMELSTPAEELHQVIGEIYAVSFFRKMIKSLKTEQE